MIVDSKISYGHIALIETFFKANELEVRCIKKTGGVYDHITFEYEDDSETCMSITFLSMKHLGFENMLVDYLQRCGVPLVLVSMGRSGVKRDMKALDEAWEVRRKELGFTR